jgi:bifunctional non-homologous end joining protein LigD
MTSKAARALGEYHRKRNFALTPEPKGGSAGEAGHSYVVQKHAARRLHYDFRLELDGVLKSWAVPKGPSLDPRDKRLAVQTEDHPLDYGGFEGVIPKGEYGGGSVEIWDRGTWDPLEDARAGLRKGALKFELHGEKLHGRFALVRIGNKGKSHADARQWLLIKQKDEESPRTGLPPFVKPELATLVNEPPQGDEWLHELKRDGIRVLLRIDEGRVRLLTREGNDWTARLSTVAEESKRLPARRALLDGEAAVVLPDGRTSFAALQNLGSAPADALVFFAFDLLHLDGENLRAQPLEARKERLRTLLAGVQGAIRYNDHVVGKGAQVVAEACASGLEGIVSKRRDSPYVSGRTRDWVKVKCRLEQELVIGGYTPPEGSRVGLGALLLGVHEEGKLRFAGKVGTGFTRKTLVDLEAALRSRRVASSPFAGSVPAAARARWVRPELVAQVAFTEWTKDGRLRHPAFLGLREDKNAQEVVRERAAAAPASRARPAGTTGDVVAGVRLTHPERVLYPGQGVTKRDLAVFYERIADAILPELRDRPLSLVRCPDGVGKACFFQKHATAGFTGTGLTRVPIQEAKKVGEYLVVNDLSGLITLVQMGTLELHTWNARAAALETPDRIVFDLDPDPSLGWPAVIAAAREVKTRLDALGLRSFLKTTGGKGLHVVVPLVPEGSWAEANHVARAIADTMARDEPKAYVAEMSKARRVGRVFVDTMRNHRGATSVAAYSTRARPGAPVSTPLAWDELTGSLRPDAWTLANIGDRLASGVDPWRDYATTRQNLPGRKRKERAAS